MSVGNIVLSFGATLLFSIFLALGVTSLMYWVYDRAVSPFVVAHRIGIVRLAGLIYLAVLYVLQDMQFRVDPHMRVFGWHWVFLNLMLVSLYVIAVQIGDWVTVALEAFFCAVYLWRYAQLTPQVALTFCVWVAVLGGLLLARKKMQTSRLWSLVGIVALGLSGVIGIYVSQPRVFDAWWWVRELGAYLVLAVFVSEYTRLTAAADAHTAALQRVAAYEQLTSTAVFSRDQANLEQMLADARRQDQRLTIAALDVDRFAEFNQKHGYLAGNVILVAIADRIQRVLTKSGVSAQLYRSGGEEFTVGFCDISATAAAAIVAACMKAVRSEPLTVDGQPVVMTMSAGLAAAHAGDKTIDELYKRADDCLRASKKAGRDQMSGSGVAATTDVPAAKLTYFAQPIENVQTAGSQQWGAELLLRQYDARTTRWSLPERFDISVEQQISLMTTVLTHSRLHSITINLTLSQFSDMNTAKALAGFATADYGPEHLIVEIITVPDLSTIRRVTAVYRDAGIRIFIDDVGSDNSYELVQTILPYIDGVKFAMQNLRKHESLDRIRERVTFWVKVARQATIDFILEGVEDEADVDFAAALGVDYFQGYYFGKPTLPQA